MDGTDRCRLVFRIAGGLSATDFQALFPLYAMLG
jgi:hypothetical protein